MDARPGYDDDFADAQSETAHAVLTQVRCHWHAEADTTTALVLHAGHDVLVLESSEPRRALPPLGTIVSIDADEERLTGRLADHGRAGRFLIALGERPVRRSLRLRVSLPATLRSVQLEAPMAVELSDLTTAGARVRGVELAVGTPITLDFTPPGRVDPVTVRAFVAHGTENADRPWIGVAFRLVALRGGR